MEEGRPPMEVASAEQEALHWQRNDDLREKWKKRQGLINTRREADSNETTDESQYAAAEVDGVSVAHPEPMQENAEAQEEEAGTLFNDRS